MEVNENSLKGVDFLKVYNDSVGTDKNGLPIHSSMYRGLKTNLPKEVMAFPDFPFKQSDESFLHHTQIRKYLQVR
jgi:cation diffusion facilitator CzcD-associated flavoprotein CzcO